VLLVGGVVVLLAAAVGIGALLGGAGKGNAGNPAPERRSASGDRHYGARRRRAAGDPGGGDVSGHAAAPPTWSWIASTSWSRPSWTWRRWRIRSADRAPRDGCFAALVPLTSPVGFQRGSRDGRFVAHTISYSNPQELQVRITRLAEAAGWASW